MGSEFSSYIPWRVKVWDADKEVRRECYCGNELFKSGGLGPARSEECGIGCGGDGRTACGGDWRFVCTVTRLSMGGLAD